MPRNPSGGGRDSYPTPQPFADWAVKRALKLLPQEPVEILEPGCGDLHPFLGACRKFCPDAHRTGIELVNGEGYGNAAEAIHRDVDFLDPDKTFWLPKTGESFSGFDLIITNPPFSQAEQFFNRSMEMLHPHGILALLLRLAFVGSKKRMPLFRSRPPAEIATFVRRPSFDGVGTDYSEYAVFYWYGSMLDRMYRGPNATVPVKFYWIDNTDMKAKEVEEFGI